MEYARIFYKRPDYIREVWVQVLGQVHGNKSVKVFGDVVYEIPVADIAKKYTITKEEFFLNRLKEVNRHPLDTKFDRKGIKK